LESRLLFSRHNAKRDPCRGRAVLLDSASAVQLCDSTAESVDVDFPNEVKLIRLLVAALGAGKKAEAVGVHVARALFAKPH